jgi:hypothetical protein
MTTHQEALELATTRLAVTNAMLQTLLDVFVNPLTPVKPLIEREVERNRIVYQKIRNFQEDYSRWKEDDYREMSDEQKIF